MLSPFLLSVAMWLLVFAALWEAMAQSGGARRWRTWAGWRDGFVYAFRRFWAQPVFWWCSILLWWPALSFFWSDDTTYWLERVRIRIPFFVLPWAFANLPLLPKRGYMGILYLLVWALVGICIGIGIHYATYEEEILVGLSRGQPIPVPRSHIRFNLILAFGIVSGAWLWGQRYVWRYTWERKALACAVVFLFGFIHFLSVRSGLAALYAALLCGAVYVLVTQRRWAVGGALLALLILAPVLALKNSPTLYTRLSYMRYDWEQYQKNGGQRYSDAERWVSLHGGLQLWREHPLIGVGIGDLPKEMRRVVGAQFPQYQGDPKLPHNQFVYLLSSLGLIGLLTALWAFLMPFWTIEVRHFFPFLAFQTIVLVSFLVEYTLETSIGAAFYLFYTLWLYRMALVLVRGE